MKPDGLEAPVEPVLRGRRGGHQRARATAVAGLGVVILVAGIGFAGNGFPAGPSAPPGPSDAGPSAVASATASARAPTPFSSLDASTLPPQTEDTGLGCAPVRLGEAPSILMAAMRGDLQLHSGVAGPARTPGAPTSAPTGALTANGWPVPPVDLAVRLTASTGVRVVSEPAACIRYVVAEYAPADATLSGPFPVPFRTLNVSPPRSRADLGPLPVGDWVVRVVAYFSTAIAGQEDATVREAFFRAAVLDGGPAPTPAVTPAAACATLASSGPVPEIRLVAGPGTTFMGEPTPGDPGPVVAVPIDRPVELRVEGDACAHWWLIDVSDATGTWVELNRQENPLNDPFLVAQNRWPIGSLPLGAATLHIEAGYSADLVIDRYWRLDVSAPPFPSGRFVGANGRSVAAFVEPCSMSWFFASGSSGYASCTGLATVEPIGELHVSAGQTVRFEIPGWRVTSWNGGCGRLVVPGALEAADRPDPFIVVDNCDLGSALQSDGAVFVPRSSASVVQLLLSALKDGAQVSGRVYARVIVDP